MPKATKTGAQLACGCGYKEAAENVELKETSKHKEKELAVIEKEMSVNPIVEADCPKCKHKLAEHWEVQTRAADEPATRFFKCQKCGHVRREYK